MVMKKNMMGKSLRRTIRSSLGRYLAIVAIIALGSGMFVGQRITKPDMVKTGQTYTDEQNMFDLRLLNTYGWDRDTVNAVAGIEGVSGAEGSVYLDAYVQIGEGGEDSVYRLHSIPESINQVYLLGGRMPTAANECLMDGSRYGDSTIGSTVTVSQNNSADTLDDLAYHTYTVVGYVSTPLYMDMTRDNTTLGNGTLNTYIYIPADAFLVDYYTEIHVTIPGDWTIYSREYSDVMDEMADILKTQITPMANERYETLKAEAQSQYSTGWAEYQDGLLAYEDGKAELKTQLSEALAQIQEGQAEIDQNRAALEEAAAQLSDAQRQIDEGMIQLEQSRLELEYTKAETYSALAETNAKLLENYKLVTESLKQVRSGMEQVDNGIIQVDEGIDQIDSAMYQLDLAISLSQIQVNALETSLKAAQRVGNQELISQLEKQLASQQETLDGYRAQKAQAEQTRADLETTRSELVTQREELEATEAELEAAIDTINEGIVEAEAGKSQADNEFAAAHAQIEAVQLELTLAQVELDKAKGDHENGKTELSDAQAKLDQARADYETGKAEAEAELADVKAKLDAAYLELADARQTIHDMDEPNVYVLTRDTNVGYLALDNNSSIVSGVAKVFPLFFLLVAALICITTMSRMVEEERTQIGTLKALGYSNWAIMSKYIYYSLSAALIGCGVGTVVGSAVFPWILWNAYCIILNITPSVELVMDWTLCIVVLLSYAVVSTLVTWYCCRRTLREVPAQLIRPKAPKAGKKIFLEYFPFWNKISFLNKVMFRNVFRYQQRLLMMLVGIGGCTALLVTGFGIRDSIVDIVDVQFDEITLYDMQVCFTEGLTQEDEDAFREAVRQSADSVGFIYQSTVEAEFGGKTRDVYLIASDGGIGNFIDFHMDGQKLTMPGLNGAYLSAGAAELLGLAVGDTVLVRDANLKSLEVTISGIFENHVYNYLIVTPETLQQKWGETPANQMAFLNVREGVDVHELGAEITAMDGVMNLTICADQADAVDSMMDAMVLVVITVVVCAGLLAVIVLYNLTNINITERIREIATIKVLGFNAGETAAYVFKENTLLSVMGAAIGLVGGRFLLGFVMSQIKIDMVWFLPRCTVWSYVFAVILTMLSALFVDFIFYFRLEKINMAEALKSVE